MAIFNNTAIYEAVTNIKRASSISLVDFPLETSWAIAERLQFEFKFSEPNSITSGTLIQNSLDFVNNINKTPHVSDNSHPNINRKYSAFV